MKCFKISCICLLMMYAASLPGSSNYHYTKIQVENGLSESSVYCIMQDPEGFMWFGTKDGLNRYDGINFKVYRSSPGNTRSIGNNFIRSMADGGENCFYIGTDAGLYVMDVREETFDKVNVKTAEGEAIDVAVNALYVDREQQIVWVGTMLKGLFAYNRKDNTLEKVRLKTYDLGANAVWSILKDKSGILWIGTRIGLLRYNAQTKEMEAMEGLFDLSGGYDNEVLSMLEDEKGNLWLGTWADGIRFFNKQSNQYVSYLGLGSPVYVSHIRALFQYDETSILVGSDDGLYLFDMNQHTVKRMDVPQLDYSLSDQNVYSFQRDKEGGIWIGTYFGGINYMNVSQLAIETYYPGIQEGMLSGKAVSQLCEDKDGNLWIATEDGGVNYFNVKTKEITQPIRTSYHNTHAVLLDGDKLWIGTFSRGVDVYDLKTKTLKNYRRRATGGSTLNDDCIFSLYKTRDGELYAGTPVGLNRYDSEANTFEEVAEVPGFIYDLKEDNQGNLWVATYGTGAMRRDAETRTWIHYDTIHHRNNPIVGSKLTSIYVDNQQRVIFSSEGRGIFIYDPVTDNFRNISETDGLPNNVVYGVLDDPYGNLWISCNKGLVCFNTSNPSACQLFDMEDGLQSNQFNYKSSYKSADGKFYFGGINGFSCFYPKNLNDYRNRIVPPVLITSIAPLGNPDPAWEKELLARLYARETIRLPYDQASVRISYVSLSYLSQAKNRYAYKMEGVDKDWVDVGNTKDVTYVDLPPGTYKFRVKGSNNSGVWNEEGAEVEIEITPPFWWTATAKMIYLLLTLLVIFLCIYSYIYKNRKKQERYMEAYKQEQETLSFKSKIHFFTDIAHEIRTPLSLINAPLEEVVASGEGSQETKKNLSVIEKNCNRLMDLVNQLLDFRKMDSNQYIVNPEPVDLGEFLAELYERFRKTAQRKNIHFELSLPQETGPEAISDRDALTKIVGNLLTNAIKYTKDKIVLTLTVNGGKEYTISVRDNGRGISGLHKPLIFEPFYQAQLEDHKIGTGIGLSLVKNLSEVLDANVHVDDAPGGGTVFSFIFKDLPMERTEDERQRKVPDTEDETDDGDTKDRRKSLLIVDDHADMAHFIRDSFLSQYAAETALDASEALEKLEEKNFDLIISDIMMPGIDGISFTRKLKTDLNYSHIPVILLSARTENVTKVEGLRSGADVFIEKPFSMSYLKAQVSSLLENRMAIQEAFNRSPLASYSTLATNKNDEMFLNRLNDEIEKFLSDENFSVESLTDVLGISRSNLQRKLKSICGATPGDYLRNYRLKRACKLLLESDMRINEVAYRVGFNSASFFTKAFYKVYKMTPKEFIQVYK